jgi:hypothetical protein
MGEQVDVLYPVLLDSTSPSVGETMGTPAALEQGDNFAFVNATSNSLHIYFVATGRTILRHKVRLSRAPPTPAPPPLPPPPAGCTSFRVDGAGNTSANGVYVLVNQSFDVSSGNVVATNAVFRKDYDHQM